MTALTRPRTVPTLILRALCTLGILVSVPALALGVYVVSEDAKRSAEPMHGLGIMLGGLLAGVAAVAIALLSVLLLILCRWPRVGLWVTTVLSGLFVLLSVLCGAQATVGVGGTGDTIGLVVFGGGGLAILGLAVWGLAPLPSGATTAPYGEMSRAPRSD